MKQYTAVLFGAGNRGRAYSAVIRKYNSDKFRVIAVAEPVQGRREYAKKLHGIEDEMCFAHWSEILSRPKMADLAIICTMDDDHFAPAMKAIELGYDILLEKPVAPTAEECVALARAAEEKGVKVLVCHVLRYTPFFGKIKEMIMNGDIGDVMSMIMVEAVGHRHQSHSFVRGNWHSEEETTPMILAKSCHDMDMIQWLLGKKCKKVQSFGGLSYFSKEYAPEGAPVRCADGNCPAAETCHYNCMKLYYDDKNNNWFRNAATRGIAKGDNATDEEVLEALKTTDYGLCVYQANNDVVDHQAVNLEFEGGTTVSFQMNAFNKGGRYVRIFGTEGELFAHANASSITWYRFSDRQTVEVPVPAMDESIVSGHGGGDYGIITELYDYLNGEYKGFRAADITTSVKNHMIGFAAEKARHSETVVSLDEFMAQYGMKN